jgi:hypothetical protein
LELSITGLKPKEELLAQELHKKAESYWNRNKRHQMRYEKSSLKNEQETIRLEFPATNSKNTT